MISDIGPSYRHPEHRGHPIESCQQRVDLSNRVVCREAGSRGSCHVHPPMQWPGAVVTDPNSDSGIVEDLADIMRVDAVDDEGDRARTVLAVGRSDHTDPGTLRETGEQGLGEGVLMGRHPRHTEGGEVVARCGQAHGLGPGSYTHLTLPTIYSV